MPTIRFSRVSTGERSAKGAAIGFFAEPQPFERAQKLGRQQLDNEAILIAEFLGREDLGVNRCHTGRRSGPSKIVPEESLFRLIRSIASATSLASQEG